MLITIEEIRQLRETLDENRMEHEVLVTKAKILREHCQVMKEMCDHTSKEMLAVITSSRQSRQDAKKVSAQPTAGSQKVVIQEVAATRCGCHVLTQRLSPELW